MHLVDHTTEDQQEYEAAPMTNPDAPTIRLLYSVIEEYVTDPQGMILQPVQTKRRGTHFDLLATNEGTHTPDITRIRTYSPLSAHVIKHSGRAGASSPLDRQDEHSSPTVATAAQGAARASASRPAYSLHGVVHRRPSSHDWMLRQTGLSDFPSDFRHENDDSDDAGKDERVLYQELCRSFNAETPDGLRKLMAAWNVRVYEEARKKLQGRQHLRINLKTEAMVRKWHLHLAGVLEAARGVSELDAEQMRQLQRQQAAPRAQLPPARSIQQPANSGNAPPQGLFQPAFLSSAVGMPAAMTPRGPMVLPLVIPAQGNPMYLPIMALPPNLVMAPQHPPLAQHPRPDPQARRKVCTVCARPTIGHPRPHGRNCRYGPPRPET